MTDQSVRIDNGQCSLCERTEALLHQAQEERLDFSPAEIARLVHDLSVHQIELELQNEELRRVQNELERSRDRYARLYHQAPVGYLTLDHNGIIQQVNQTFAEMVGRQDPDLIGGALADLMVDSDRPTFLGRFRAFFNQPAGKCIEAILHRPDGQTLHARLTGRQDPEVPVSPRSSPRLLVIVQDISDQKVTEEALRENRAFQDQLLDTLPTPVFYKDIEGRYLGCNSAFTALMGRSQADIIGKTVHDIAPKALADIYQAQDRDLLQGTAGSQVCQGSVVDAEGSRREALFYKARIVGLDGILRGVIGVILDITERKRIEQALAESEANLARAQAIAHIGSWQIDFQHDPPRWWMSDECYRIHGFPEGMPVSLSARLMRIHPQDRARVAATWFATTPAEPDIDIEYRIVVEGAIKWLRLRGELIFDAGGRPLRLTGTVQDITVEREARRVLAEYQERLEGEVAARTAELRHSRDQLLAANAALARAARLKDEFLASMSHELRTPLTAILGLTDALGEQVYGPLTDKSLEMLKMIGESGRRLLALINDILDLARIEAGQVELDLGPCVLAEVGQASMKLVKGMASKKRQQVELTVEPPDLMVPADGRRLKQMLVNLLSNAVKFTPEGGWIGLDITGDRDAGVVRFTVWDTGIGIAAEDLPKLFETFVQLDGRRARRYEGTGLGLPLVKRIAELHHGEVSVTSTPGQGSRFTLTLPWIPLAVAV